MGCDGGRGRNRDDWAERKTGAADGCDSELIGCSDMVRYWRQRQKEGRGIVSVVDLETNVRALSVQGSPDLLVLRTTEALSSSAWSRHQACVCF